MKKIIGMVHGVFDVLHIGHILHFKEAKSKVDYLIASVTIDKFVNKSPGKPIFNITERVEVLKSLKFFDEVVISDSPTAVSNLLKFKPNIYFKGADYVKSKDLNKNLKKEKLILKKWGAEIHFTKTKLFSSSEIINKNFSYLNSNIKKILQEINLKSFKERILNLKRYKKRVLIIGDPIIDVYNYVKTSGRSSKSSVISSQFYEQKKFGGGTILVANTLLEFNENIDFLFVGSLKDKNQVKKYLNKKINIIHLKNSKNCLIEKKRYLEGYSKQKLFQISENENKIMDFKNLGKIKNLLNTKLKKYDKIYFFDYGYLYKIPDINSLIKKNKNKFIINCQSNSYNYGFNLATKYKFGDVISMDEPEFRLCVNDRFSSVESLIKKNSKLFKNFKELIVTSGKYGCHVLKGKKITFVQSIFQNLQDTTGCGDVFLAIYSLKQLKKNFSIKENIILAHIASALHGFESGNGSTLKYEDLINKSLNILN